MLKQGHPTVCGSINFILNGISLKNNICCAQLHLQQVRPTDLPTCCASWVWQQTVNICDTGFKCWVTMQRFRLAAPLHHILLQPNSCCPFAVSPSAACKLVRYYNIQQHCNLATLAATHYNICCCTLDFWADVRENEKESERDRVIAGGQLLASI